MWLATMLNSQISFSSSLRYDYRQRERGFLWCMPKKTEPHPSKLPELSKEEVLELERTLRKMIDAWAWLQVEQEKEQYKKLNGLLGSKEDHRE